MVRFQLVLIVLLLVMVVFLFFLVVLLLRKMQKHRETNLEAFFEAFAIYSPALTLFRDKEGKLISNELMGAKGSPNFNRRSFTTNEIIEQKALKEIAELKGNRGATTYCFSATNPIRSFKISSVPIYDNYTQFTGVVDFILDITEQDNSQKQCSASVKALDYCNIICNDLWANLNREINFTLLAHNLSLGFGCDYVHLWLADKQYDNRLCMQPLTNSSPIDWIGDANNNHFGSFGGIVNKSLIDNNPIFVANTNLSTMALPFEWIGKRENLWVHPIAIPGSSSLAVMVMVNLSKELTADQKKTELASALVGLSISITQRCKHETLTLAKKNDELQRLAFLMDNLPGVVYTCKNNPQWDMMFLSHGIVELTGYSAHEIIGGAVKYGQIIYPDDRAMVSREVEMGLTEAGCFELTYRIVTKNNKVKWVWERGKISGFNSLGVMLLDGLIIDITQQIETDKRAVESQTFIDTMIDALPFQINVLSNDGYVKERQFHRGKNRQQVLADHYAGMHIRDIVEAKDADRIATTIQQIIDYGGVADVEWRLLPLEPSRWFESRMVKIANDEALMFSREITERKRNDAKVAESELLFRSLFDMGNIAMGIVGSDGTFSLVNSKLAQLLETDLGDNPTLKWSQIIIPEESDYDQQIFLKLERENLTTYQSEKRLLKSNGAIVYTHFTLFLLKNEYLQSVKFIASFIDISDRMNLERRVLNTMIETEEKERVRMARELHDGVGPLLSSLKMYLQWMQLKDSKANKQELMADAETLIDQTLETIRDISFNLSPHLLQNYGLAVALESFIAKVKGVGSLSFHFNANGLTGRIGEESEVILYRALTECINNTLKYAQAQNVFIDFALNNPLLTVTYRDDGIGFDALDALDRKTGMGLFNMQSRLKAINGKAHFKSEIGKGCHIELELNI